MKSSSKYVLVAMIAVAFLFFVWPTPYTYSTYHGVVYRTNRISGEQQASTPAGWTQYEKRIKLADGSTVDNDPSYYR